METEFSQRIHTLYRISIVGAILRIIVDKKLEHWLVNIFFFHLHVFAAKKWLVLKWVRLIRALIKSKLVPFYLIYSNSFGTSHSIMSLITTTYIQTKRSHTMNTFSNGFSELLFVPFVYYFHISTKRPVNILNYHIQLIQLSATFISPKISAMKNKNQTKLKCLWETPNQCKNSMGMWNVKKSKFLLKSTFNT